jgi:hypothetical protein
MTLTAREPAATKGRRPAASHSAGRHKPTPQNGMLVSLGTRFTTPAVAAVPPAKPAQANAPCTAEC